MVDALGTAVADLSTDGATSWTTSSPPCLSEIENYHFLEMSTWPISYCPAVVTAKEKSLGVHNGVEARIGDFVQSQLCACRRDGFLSVEAC